MLTPQAMFGIAVLLILIAVAVWYLFKKTTKCDRDIPMENMIKKNMVLVDEMESLIEEQKRALPTKSKQVIDEYVRITYDAK